MEKFRNFIVGLDTSELDATLVRYASFLVDHSSAEKVQFVNIVRNLNIPASVKKEFPDIIPNSLNERKSKMIETVEANFNPQKKVKVSYLVKEGQASVLLNLAQKSGTDLIIIGQKKKLNGSGGITVRLARRANCNLLIVPEQATPGVKKFLVPIDFSDYSKLALDQTIDFAVRTGGKGEIFCQNVYTVPAGYHYTGKSFQEFAEIMKKNAQESFHKFLKKIDPRGIKINEVYSLDVTDNLASDIYDVADEIDADFVMIGAKGRTAAAALFLGSLAEKMVTEKMHHPLLVVRFKGKNAGIFETLREI